MFGDRSTFDFKVASFGGDTYLTFIACMSHEWATFRWGAGVVLDASYQQVSNITISIEQGRVMNPHEFTIIDDGGSAIVLWTETLPYNAPDGWEGQLAVDGFALVDLDTGLNVFDWRSIDHVPIVESTIGLPTSEPEHGRDYLYATRTHVCRFSEG